MGIHGYSWVYIYMHTCMRGCVRVSELWIFNMCMGVGSSMGDNVGMGVNGYT